MASPTWVICWDSVDVFTIGVQFQALGGAVHADVEEMVELDTGYAGEVLVPWHLYIGLDLYRWELEEELWSVGVSVTGENFTMPLSRAVLRIPKLEATFLVQVDTFEDNDQFLIGRALIRKHRVLFDGPANRVCVIPAVATIV